MKKRITMGKATVLSIREAYEQFERKAKVRNMSENTLKTYGYHMDSFCSFTDGEQPVSNISEKMLDEYTLFLKNERKIKDITMDSYLRTMRNFLHFCMDNGWVERFKITMPKYEKRIKQTYSDDELRRLLKKPDMKKCTFTEFRVWTFENFLIGTGCRISSALNVKLEDVDFEGGVITIKRAKNRKQQIIPLSRTLA